MPNTTAAKKALRQTKKRTVLNIVKKKKVKELSKDLLKAIEEKSDTAQKLLSTTVKALDKAAKSNTIHPNKAARHKASLQKKYNAVFPPKAKAEKK